MNKNVNPLVALAIVIVFGGLLGLKFYFYGKALDVPKVQYLKKSPTGSLFIKLDTKLYDYSAQGSLNRIIDLKQIGIIEDMGDFDFFSNGDLLINRDNFLPTLEDKFDSYRRKTNTKSKAAEDGKGLLRCNLSTFECSDFNLDIPAIQGAHYLYIDRNTDDVYLADTSRHQVRKFNQSGELLAEIKSGLKFPNQVYLEGEKLWIVDTNNHIMKAVDASTENFGSVIEEHKTTLESPWIWPSAFSRVGDNWWVHISDNGMENARIAIYDKHWQLIDRLKLPENADPVSSVMMGDSVVIADALNYVLYQFNANGFRQIDFAQSTNPQGIQAVLQKNKKQDEKYRLWSNLSLWLMIGLFIPLFVYAVMQSVKDSKNDRAKREAETTEEKAQKLAGLPPDGEWIEAKPKIKYFKWLIVALPILSVLSLVYMNSIIKEALPINITAIIFSLRTSC